MRFRILKETDGEFLPTGQTVEITDVRLEEKKEPSTKAALSASEAVAYLEELKTFDGASYAFEADK